MDSCYGGSYNIGDTIYLFNPVENKYEDSYVNNPYYDFENSTVKSSGRSGFESRGYSIYKAIDGKLVEIERGSSDFWEREERIEKLINNQWIVIRDYSVEFDSGKCIYSLKKLIDGKLITVRAEIYYLDKSGHLIIENKKFNEKGEVIESFFAELSQECKKLMSGTTLESNNDCMACLTQLEGSGCY